MMQVRIEERFKIAENTEIMRFKCTKCGLCCSDSKTFINITYLDILGLMKGLKLNEIEIMKYIGFYTFKGENPENYMEHMVFSPLNTEKGIAFIGLLRNEKSKCIFLDETNTCKIYNYRPKICRTFPFTYNLIDSNEKTSKLDLKYAEKGIEYCPGISLKAPLIKKKKHLTVITNFLAEIAADFKIIDSWNKLVKNKSIKPLAAQYIKSIVRMEQEIKNTPPKNQKKGGRKFQHL